MAGWWTVLGDPTWRYCMDGKMERGKENEGKELAVKKWLHKLAVC